MLWTTTALPTRRGGASGVLGALLDLALPLRCAGCGSEGAALCGPCIDALDAVLRAGPARARPVPSPAGLPLTATAGVYAGVARALVIAHKERGRAELARPLGLLLASAITAAAPPGPFAVVAVPTSAVSRRRRGRDPLRAITVAAVAALRDLAVPAVAVPLLRVSGRPRDQAGLSGADRAGNVAGAFAPDRREPGIPVVLVDDVLTTGATLAEAARAARSGGAQVHSAAVIAATVLAPDRRSGHLTATSATRPP